MRPYRHTHFCLPIGTYQYTEDLYRLESARPSETPQIKSYLQAVSSPLRDHLPAWSCYLADHPDSRFRDYMLNGIQYGFRIGFDYSAPLRSARQNMLLATNHPEAIDEYIKGEVEEDCRRKRLSRSRHLTGQVRRQVRL